MSRITVFLRGGLGNQMFQYALGFNLAKKNNADLVLDTTFLNDRFPRKEFTYRAFDLDVFTLSPSQVSSDEIWEGKPRFSTLSKISEKLPIPGVWLGLDLVFMIVKKIFGATKIIKEKKNHIFDPEVLSAKGNIILWGRWQCEKYFSDIAPDIRKEFCFKEKLSGSPSQISSDETWEGEAVKIAQEIESTNSISIHVRRGDYVKFENMKKIAGETDVSYYTRAISYIAERVISPNFFVFSDDIPWCRENLWFDATHHKKIPPAVTFLDEKTAGSKNSYHLELMSLCKHNIIANSTFSWWGAWLNKNPQKIVIAPKRWYGGEDSDTIDIIPADWKKI
ncbi:MAG: hypothetical protein A3B13_01085 [Candidatus Liptonbacteria bacterium RIFCSPLOWO2_01_FULL_45_15]|uniref:Glycosyl transferase family 11 n=1 Tax=Candidatus Liptonbacteria bacterium RIFCSPLOWO2_01_FULL_45_15 TaxID=1798649 RepID=A0A1G2CD94_9BACT|nr:MAG: hypothetical protein A3B13_01085 [Candidatus Liptonbacteria bacterium RIFCSPLOWO2_01_FULL_45_15]